MEMHNDVMTWKHFPRYWPFVIGSPAHLHKGPEKRGFGVFFAVSLNKLLENSGIGGDLRRHGAHVMALL